MERLSITLDEPHAEKLSRLAESMRVPPQEVARVLLSRALEEVEPNADHIVELLKGIPGSYERAQLGLAQARAGRTVALDEW